MLVLLSINRRSDLIFLTLVDFRTKYLVTLTLWRLLLLLLNYPILYSFSCKWSFIFPFRSLSSSHNLHLFIIKHFNLSVYLMLFHFMPYWRHVCTIILQHHCIFISSTTTCTIHRITTIISAITHRMQWLCGFVFEVEVLDVVVHFAGVLDVLQEDADALRFLLG